MSTTVRIVCEVEITVDTWDSQSTFESLGKAAVKEGLQKVAHARQEGFPIQVIKVNEVKFVTHSIPWEKDSK
jgi:hypothetical protein